MTDPRTALQLAIAFDEGEHPRDLFGKFRKTIDIISSRKGNKSFKFISRTKMDSKLDDFLLEHGGTFEVNPDKDVQQIIKDRGLETTMKYCFRNAANGAARNPDLHYVEGYAYAGEIPIPLHHAWLIDNDGDVIDPTWPNGHDYFGAIIPEATIRKVQLKTGVFGVLTYEGFNALEDS